MDVAVAEAEYQRTIVTECTKSIHNPIKRNKLPLFNKPQPGQQHVRPTGKNGSPCTAVHCHFWLKKERRFVEACVDYYP